MVSVGFSWGYDGVDVEDCKDGAYSVVDWADPNAETEIKARKAELDYLKNWISNNCG